jgi:hypothetical protein
MTFPGFHSVSAHQDSSFSVTTNPIWSTARSLSEPASPTSEISNLSDELSELSESVQQLPSTRDSSSHSVHPNPIPTTTSTLQSVLSDPSTLLSLPIIPVSTTKLKSSTPKMTQSSYVIPPLAQMPIRGNKNAPATFKGNYKYVETFIDHYNRLLDYYHVVSDSDKCRGILEYCNQNVKDFIQINPHYLTPNWDQLQTEILNAYDADRMNSRIRPKEFFKLVQHFGQGQISNLSQWKRYHREYIAKAGFLKQNKQLNDLQYHGYYWYGIPQYLQGVFEIRLQARNPTFDNSQPWPIPAVHEVAESYFKRTKFSSQLPHLPSLGYEEEEEEDSDDDYDFDSDDSDDYEEEKSRRAKRKLKKKKKIVTKKFLPTQITSELPSRNILPPPEEKGMDGLIHRLNTMSIDDPQYGTLYYQAVSHDATGLVAQCITRKPKQITTNKPLPSRDPPPHQYPPRQPQPPYQQPYPRGIIPRPPGLPMLKKCYGCFEVGHPLRDCPKMAQLLHRKEVKIDPVTFEYQLPEGLRLDRKTDECLFDTFTRMRSNQRTVQFATLGNEVKNFYETRSRRSFLQCSYSDSEDDGDEYECGYTSEMEREDDNEYEEGHWKHRLKSRKHSSAFSAEIESYDEDDEDDYEHADVREYPSYVAYRDDTDDEDNYYRSYPAERADKERSTRQAREFAMNNPIKRNQLDGVYMPPKRFTRSSEKLPEKPPVSYKSLVMCRLGPEAVSRPCRAAASRAVTKP